MKFQDFKIGQKIVTGFAAISIIALAIGVTGIVSMGNIGTSFHHVSDENLPSIYNLGVMESRLEKVQRGYNLLLDPELSRDERDRILLETQAARQEYIDAMAAYDALTHLEAEIPVYNELMKDIENWRNINVQKVDRLHARLLDLDILNPMEVTKDLEIFTKDHYKLMVEVKNAIDNRMSFEGGESAEQCHFGK